MENLRLIGNASQDNRRGEKMMDEKKKKRQEPTKDESSAYFAGMDAAMLRAAVKSRRRAIEMTGSVPTWRNGEIVYDTEV